VFSFLRLKGFACNLGLRLLRFFKGLVPAVSGKNSQLVRTR
jgi:hypothetical protein